MGSGSCGQSWASFYDSDLPFCRRTSYPTNPNSFRSKWKWPNNTGSLTGDGPQVLIWRTTIYAFHWVMLREFEGFETTAADRFRAWVKCWFCLLIARAGRELFRTLSNASYVTLDSEHDGHHMQSNFDRAHLKEIWRKVRHFGQQRMSECWLCKKC